jgi:hypothetical protein
LKVVPRLDVRVHFLAGVGAPKRPIWKTPFSSIETVAKINKCCFVPPLRTFFLKHDLTPIGAAGSFVKGEDAGEFLISR